MLSGDYREEWEEFPDDWYDGCDEIMRKARIQLIKKCYEISPDLEEG